MRSRRGGYVWFAVVFGLFALALTLPGVVARFVRAGAVPTNAFQTRETFGGVHVATGSHSGNGIDGRAIGGLGFAPDFVVVKSHGTDVAVARTATMPAGATKPLAGAAALLSDGIQSLDADGFTLGGGGTVNGSGEVYSWVAFRAAPGAVTVGSYAGTSAAESIAGFGFSPDYVIVLGSGAEAAVQRSTSMSTTYRFDEPAAAADGIVSLDATGFTVGTSTEVNAAFATYHYVAWDETVGATSVGSYSGDGSDDRTVGTPGFVPDAAIVRRSTMGSSCDRAVHRTADVSGDRTLTFTESTAFADGLQAWPAGGFEVGTDCRVNTNGATYHFVAFRDF